MRSWGLTSRATVGGNQPPGSLHGKYAPATIESYAPSGLILLGPPLERSKFSQALIDVGALCIAAVLACVSVTAIGVSLFILLVIGF